MMMFTVQDALDEIATSSGAGLCSGSKEILRRYNAATRRLMPVDDFSFTLDRLRILAKNNSVTLPREYEAARFVNFDGTPGQISPAFYEYLASGPGECPWDQCIQLIDEGTHPVYFDIPKDRVCRLLAYSTNVRDNQLTISLQGRASNGSEVLTSSGTSTLSLPINQWDKGIEGNILGEVTNYCEYDINSLTSLKLPSGRKGYVTLYAYDPATGQMWFMAKYHPAEKNPAYRRYRMPKGNQTDGVMVNILAKKQFIPAVSGDEIMLVQNLDAVKLMAKAIEAEDANQLDMSVALKQLAVQNLQIQETNHTKGAKQMYPFIDDGVPYGIEMM